MCSQNGRRALPKTQPPICFPFSVHTIRFGDASQRPTALLAHPKQPGTEQGVLKRGLVIPSAGQESAITGRGVTHPAGLRAREALGGTQCRNPAQPLAAPRAGPGGGGEPPTPILGLHGDHSVCTGAQVAFPSQRRRGGDPHLQGKEKAVLPRPRPYEGFSRESALHAAGPGGSGSWAAREIKQTAQRDSSATSLAH